MRRRLTLIGKLAAGTGLAVLLSACAAGPDRSGTRPSNSAPPPDSPSGTAGAPTAELEVVVVRAPGGPEQRWVLRCLGAQPLPGTTHPDAAAACAIVAARSELLRPPPTDRLCTQLYGGPEVATVTGKLGGALVNRRFTRTDGCGTAEWTALQPLLGAPADGV